MAFTDIDRVNGYTIRKMHSPDKTKSFGFIVGKKDEEGNLLEKLSDRPVSTLTEARKLAGFDPKPSAVQTPPKSAHPQNRKGYRADSVSSKKGG